MVGVGEHLAFTARFKPDFKPGGRQPCRGLRPYIRCDGWAVNALSSEPASFRTSGKTRRESQRFEPRALNPFRPPGLRPPLTTLHRLRPLVPFVSTPGFRLSRPLSTGCRPSRWPLPAAGFRSARRPLTVCHLPVAASGRFIRRKSWAEAWMRWPVAALPLRVAAPGLQARHPFPPTP